jgi:hypothetical protein
LKQLVRQDAEFRRCRGGQPRLTNDVELQTVYWGTNAFGAKRIIEKSLKKESLSTRIIVNKNHCQQESLSNISKKERQKKNHCRMHHAKTYNNTGTINLPFGASGFRFRIHKRHVDVEIFGKNEEIVKRHRAMGTAVTEQRSGHLLDC